MNTPISFFLLSLHAACSACGQATFQLNNRIVGTLDAPIFSQFNSKAAGTEYVVGLFGGPAGTPESALTLQGTTLTFRTGAGAGYINTTGVDTTRRVAGTTDGGTAAVQLRAWASRFGTDAAGYTAAWAAGLAGKSTLLTLTGGGGLLTPAPLVGLQSFNAYFWPEPSVGALLMLGAGVLGLRRRKPAPE
jgi:hypothetical protein